MPRLTLLVLLAVLSMIAMGCSSDTADTGDTDVDDTAAGEDTVVGGAGEAGGSEDPGGVADGEGAAADVGDVDADPEIDPSAAEAGEAGTYTVELTLTGDAEVPGPGSEGQAIATFTIEGEEACIGGELTDVGAVAAGHIHTGTAEESGGVLLDLATTTDGDGPIDSCVAIDQATAEMITSDPAGFYVNLHTAEFPDGAVRAQLS